MKEVKLKCGFLCFFAFFSIVLSQEDKSCILPDSSTKSNCVLIYNCSFFDDIIQKFKSQTATNTDRKSIQKHKCPNTRYDVCCPISRSKSAFGSNLSNLANHRNLNLINDERCGISEGSPLIGGYFWKAIPGQFPWMALLKYSSKSGEKNKYSFNCGGSLITPSYVLTAAHCNVPSLFEVRLGEHNITSHSDCNHSESCLYPVQDIPVVEKISHESYKKRVRQHDIALLNLQRPAKLTTRFVGTVCLPTSEDNQLKSLNSELLSKMSVMGWGITETGKTSDVLKTANLKFVPFEECVDRFLSYDQTIYEGNFCAGGTNATDPCRGDSGGPITREVRMNNKWKAVQYGILSGGVDCNHDYGEFFPAVYVDISFYLEWILNNISS